MHPFVVLGDPVRRRILEVLAGGEQAAGEVVDAVSPQFGITQSAVSQQLKVLRDHGFARVRVDGPRRIYSLDPTPLKDVDAWLAHFRAFWSTAMEELLVEVERGKQERQGGEGN